MPRDTHRNAFRFFLLTLLGCGLLLAGCGRGEEAAPKAEAPKPVRALEIAGGDTGAQRVLPGTVVAGEEVELGFRVAGQLSRLPVKEGQKVEKGQLLAQLDPKDFRTTLSGLESQLLGAKATLREAELNFERNRQLLEQDTISKATFDSARSAFENAEAQVSALNEQIHQARLNLQYTSLNAPFSGTVASTFVKNYENVKVQQPVLKLEDTSSLDILVEVPEFLMIQLLEKADPAVEAGPVAVFAAVPEREFPLRLKEVETTANPTTQTYTTTLTMKQPGDIEILPGMTAEVRGTLPGEDTASVLVPVQAVMGLGESSAAVWTITEDMTVTRRPVSVGDMRGDRILVTEGLSAGDIVVTAGVAHLVEGRKVRIIEGRIGGRQ